MKIQRYLLSSLLFLLINVTFAFIHANSVGGFSTDFSVANIEPFDLAPSDIQLTAEITESNQKVSINKYFASNYTINRGDGSAVEIVDVTNSHKVHTYTTPGDYLITLSLDDDFRRWTFDGNIETPLVSKDGTTAKNIYISIMPSFQDYFGEYGDQPEDNFFAYFNYGGALTSLPAGSFDTSNITNIGDNFFSHFNANGKLTSLPVGSFDTSNITNIGDNFFSHFNANSSLTSLPRSSFDTSNIVSVRHDFFAYFNYEGALTSLPVGSFDTSNITNVGDNFFYKFNTSYFNNNKSSLTSLPEGSFNLSNITTVGDNFFAQFTDGPLTSLPAGSFNINNIITVGDDFFAGFTNGSLTSLPRGSFDTSNITNVGDNFFAYFNRDGSLTSLPAGSFDTSNITSVGYNFFSHFNVNGSLTSLPRGSFDTSNISIIRGNFFSNFNFSGLLTSLPEGSFDTSNITKVGDQFFYNFNSYGKLISLPAGSFDTSNITSVGDNFFSNFNSYGKLISLPAGSFDTSNIVSVRHNFFSGFNYYGKLIQTNTGVTIKAPNLQSLVLHYRTLAGTNKAVNIGAGGSFKYYPTTIYTVELKDNDGTILLTESVAHGDLAPTLTNITKIGYTFEGRYQDKKGTIKYNFNTPVTDNISLYAKWTKQLSGEGGEWDGGGGGEGGGGDNTPPVSTGDQKTLEKEENKPEETPKKEATPQTSTPDTNETLIKEFRAQHQNNPERLAQLETALASVADSTATTELKQAYTYAYLRGITTMNTIQDAGLDRGLTRAEMAKMMAVYATQVLDKKPLKTDVPLYQDIATVGGDLPGYIQLAYQLQIMGVDANGNAIPQFNPHGLVSRAEFATVLSRVLFGNKYNQGGSDYYSVHLSALKEAKILSNTTPEMEELRGWVMLMLMRTENVK